MDIDFINIKNIYDTHNFTPTNIIHNKINKYINIFNNLNNYNNNNKNIFIGYIDKYNNNLNGNGLFIKNNILIEGNIKNNNFYNSNCNFIFNNSTNIQFNGSIINNKIKNGILSYNNIKLSGEFLDALPHNICSVQNNNSIYTGKWIKGKKYGYGVFQSNNNLKYEGEWFNNLFHGKGILYNNNIIYDGDFFKGKKHGNGSLLIDSNTFYVEYNYNKQLLKITSHEKKILDLTKNNNSLTEKLDESTNIILKQENLIMNYNTKIKKLEQENKKLEDIFICKICFKNTPNILLLPCSHLCVCEDCVKKITNKKCPICRNLFRQINTIFIS